jgi:hypothetical protein
VTRSGAIRRLVEQALKKALRIKGRAMPMVAGRNHREQ